MTHRVQYNPYLHTARAYLLLVESLTRPADEAPLPKTRGDEMSLPIPRFQPTEAQRQRVEQLLRDARGPLAGPMRTPLIVVNPNASDMLPLRKWPASRFEELIRRLLEAFERGTIVLTGAPGERPAIEEISRAVASSRVVNLAGRTELNDLLTLYTMADVLVTNDSGPGHFASLANLPCVVLFGPETPRLFAPLGDHVRVLYEPPACSPCVNVFNHRFSPCTDNACMRAITVDAVLAEVHSILAGRHAPSLRGGRAEAGDGTMPAKAGV
jgi:ADP-heptose:LPS heptosyltransferase